MIALSVDVDTHDGMRVGVPRLLDAFKAHGVRATFFLSLGPDRSGRAMIQVALNPRFLLKMVGTGAPSLYGWRTILSGTVLPERPIATAFPEIVRRIEDEGHEAAIHAWDHRSWQDELPRFKTHRIEAHFTRALHAFRNLTGRDPWGIRAPAWMTTPESLLLQDRLPLRYASDLRASPACFLTTPLGQPRLPQFPGSGACLEELLPRGLGSNQELGEALADEVLGTPAVVRCATLHAEVEGGPFAGVLDHLLPRLRAAAPVVPMQEAVAGRELGLPLRRWALRRLPGRAMPSSTSLPLPQPRKAGG
jgi:undecaprenyl phosphate-alpha-L-ara4FN deformylase